VTAAAEAQHHATDRFRHEAVVYRSLHDLVEILAPFVVEGLAHGEQVMVAMPPDRNRALQDALGADAAKVEFLDMLRVGANPARIIPAWRDFVAEHPGQPLRGVGEPAWPGRRPAELEECRLHEALLNVAFDEGTDLQLLCPYDTADLPDDVVAGAMRTHPEVAGHRRHEAYGGHGHARAQFQASLSDPPPTAEAIDFTIQDLRGLRSVVARLCQTADLSTAVTDDLVLAVDELASNSVEHGGGRGTLRSWTDPDEVVFEVSDPGVIDDPLVGRETVAPLSESGRGIWMANQLCDLVQVRSAASGTTVRLHSWT